MNKYLPCTQNKCKNKAKIRLDYKANSFNSKLVSGIYCLYHAKEFIKLYIASRPKLVSPLYYEIRLLISFI